MSGTVCCPSCWSWSALGKDAHCRRCGTALTFADGRIVGEVLAAHAHAVASGVIPATYPVPVGGPAGPGLSPMNTQGTIPGWRQVDWVAVAKWFAIIYGGLIGLLLLLVGLLVQHISLPTTDPYTGLTTTQTFNLGPAFAIAGMIVFGVFALCGWLTQFTAARVVFLVVDGLSILGELGHVGATSVGALTLANALGLLIDLAYGAVVLLSLLSPEPPRPWET